MIQKLKTTLTIAIRTTFILTFALSFICIAAETFPPFCPYSKDMRIQPLPLTVLLLHRLAAAAHGGMGALHHRDTSGGTNLQKISTLLKESQEQQNLERKRRMTNVALARTHLSNCATLADCSERSACQARYTAIVRGALRACGTDCPEQMH